MATTDPRIVTVSDANKIRSSAVEESREAEAASRRASTLHAVLPPQPPAGEASTALASSDTAFISIAPPPSADASTLTNASDESEDDYKSLEGVKQIEGLPPAATGRPERKGYVAEAPPSTD